MDEENHVIDIHEFSGDGTLKSVDFIFLMMNTPEHHYRNRQPLSSSTNIMEL